METQKGLKALLPSPENQKTLSSLVSQAQTITNQLAANISEAAPELRQAAVRCTVLMENARMKGDGPDHSVRNRRLIILGATAAAVAALYIVLIMDR